MTEWVLDGFVPRGMHLKIWDGRVSTPLQFLGQASAHDAERRMDALK